MITTDEAASLLQTTSDAILTLLNDLSDTQMRRKPDAASWSPLEVLCHLIDEEREDFRQRIDYTLHRPTEFAPPIAPGQWVTERAYNSRNVAEMQAQFRAERQQSLEWLRNLPSPNWEQPVNHPRAQELRAGELLASWVAHDLLHLRQLIELRYALACDESNP